MIESVIGSKVKVRVLRTMMERDREYILHELVQKLGSSTGCVHPAMKGLVERRIVLSSKVGRSTVFRLNKSHILYNALKVLFDKERSGYREIAKEYADSIDKRDIVNVILFGSVARGDTLIPGDIDILEITKRGGRSDPDGKATSAIEEKYDVHISSLSISKNEVKNRLKKFESFIITVLDEGIILYGDDEWLRK